MKTRHYSTRSAFTLIEILVVLVIIMILAGIVIGAAKYAETKAASSRAQAEIASMEAALEHYKSDNGGYPPSTGSRLNLLSNSGSLYAALAGGGKIYYTFRPNQIGPRSGITCIIDPFGSPYNYYYKPGADDLKNGGAFDLWSYGPDGQSDTADDLVNWRR